MDIEALDDVIDSIINLRELYRQHEVTLAEYRSELADWADELAYHTERQGDD